MPYCLGLHIDNNYIKYAKVLNEKDKAPKVEAYGVVLGYENFSMAIENILKETSTYGNVEVATNLRNEFYSYLEAFSGMTGNNLRKNLNLKFQTEICPKLNITASSVESRYISSSKKFDEDTTEVIYISANKTDLNEAKKIVKGKVKKIIPTSIANLSLIDINSQSNFAILNIDSNSTLTIVVQGQIKEIVNINMGMSNILVKLNQKYNSYNKSYEKCKSITLFNDNTKELIVEENYEDVENITPMLYDIAQRAIPVLSGYQGVVNKVYIAGDAVIINNIDLYFEDLFEDIKCEILKPSFIENNLMIANKIKDYTEVNSAIALAVSNGKIGSQNVNFAYTGQLMEELNNNKAINAISGAFEGAKHKVTASKTNEKIEKQNFNIQIYSSTLILQVILWSLVLATYIYVTKMVEDKYAINTAMLNEEIFSIQQKNIEIENDIRMINEAKYEYDALIERVEALNAELLEVAGVSYDVPRLMDNISMLIPDKVIVTKIIIDESNTVEISAECAESAELGFFVSRLKNEEVMENITTFVEEQNGQSKKIKIIGEII